MRIRFWGTRGSIATAGQSTKRYGGNTSCVEVVSNAGTLAVLDCGTGAALLGRSLVETDRAARGHLLISHTHWDHIQGFPFFDPLFVPGAVWDVYGRRDLGGSLRETLSGQMQDTYFPISIEALEAEVRFHDLVEGAFDLAGDVRVRARYLNHPAVTLGYRLEADGVSLVYACDHEPHAERAATSGYRHGTSPEDDAHVDFLAGADLVIHDAPFTREQFPDRRGWGHSPVEYAVDVAHAAGARRLAFTHHDPAADDAAVDELLTRAWERAAALGGSLEVIAASEGFEIELEPAPARPERARLATPEARRTPRALIERSVLLAVPGGPLAEVLEEAALEDGVEVVPARSGAEVLRIAREAQDEPPSLLLVGLELADGSALEVCRALRDLGDAWSEVPIVIVTEREDQVDPKAGAAAGVSEWLVAPFKLAYARARMRAWLLRTACRWQKAPLPPDEEKRVRSLRELEVLDTAPDERFDRLTRLAAALFEVPTALVSLVDGERQWFKSRQGLDARETPREMAFCAHAILQDDVFVVRDSLADDRFAENPLVTGEPHVRFYAGAPLALPDGSRVGTLCLLDSRPRDFDETQCALLRDLARLAARELGARWGSQGS